ncbi:hypothetical protein MMF93_07405 [Streptomyces tubbatahanensis]|uniref:DUF1795 domain-containing protein n=1 Tax=Streptomyces tubbatahanensis TaxID=2923272 RepID=A0ABY3XPH2_9ACTN|nr:hypothetical protein [Streptomyces tubbatahanensis]UNS96348.1 hypothetical protein MMF93_07405 [Streptomyces tubbatahanensis]
MPAMLPVPIEFQLPEGWDAADPDKADAPGVAFAALHPERDNGFAANITIDGEYRPDAATLSQIAEESVQRMHELAHEVQVVDRAEVGSSAAPALTQSMSFSAVSEGARRHLVQSQVYLAMLDDTDPCRRAVIRLVLTATPAQIDSVIDDFSELVGTVRPDTDATS